MIDKFETILKINPNAKVEVTNGEVTNWYDTTPISDADITAKMKELEQEEKINQTNTENAKASGKQKLLDLGLTEEEVKALIGV